MSSPQDPAATHEVLPLLGEEFAVEFANSTYRSPHEHVDFLETPPAVRSWFSQAQPAAELPLPQEVTAELVRELRSVRDAVRTLLEHAAAGRGSTGPPSGPEVVSALETLHASARRACAHVVLNTGSGGATGWTLAHDGAPDDVLIAAIASRCIVFLGGAGIDDVRACARPDCPMLFVRRHRARRFCHESCAHNLRQARYYRARTARTATR